MSSIKLKRQSALAALKAKREGGTGAGVSAYNVCVRNFILDRLTLLSATRSL